MRGTFVVNATLAVFGILPGPVLEMILRTVWYLLPRTYAGVAYATPNHLTLGAADPLALFSVGQSAGRTMKEMEGSDSVMSYRQDETLFRGTGL